MGVCAFAAKHQVDAVGSVEFHRLGEHPLHAVLQSWNGRLSPRAIGENLVSVIWCPMDKHRSGRAFAACDDVGRTVSIQVRPDGVLDGRGATDSHCRPWICYLSEAGMEVRSRDAAFFPAGGDVEEAVTVDIDQFDAVGAAGGVVDDVTGPRSVLTLAKSGERHEV